MTHGLSLAKIGTNPKIGGLGKVGGTAMGSDGWPAIVPGPE
jgi:hypothetical protein